MVLQRDDIAVMMYLRFPFSPRNVEDLLHERGAVMCRKTVRFWRSTMESWKRLFAARTRRSAKRTKRLRWSMS